MLGKTAGGLFWMFRYLERSDNTARLIDAGFRIAMTRPNDTGDEWASVIQTAGMRSAYEARHDGYDYARAVDFMLRDSDNPSGVLSAITAARTNARLVRTALTREAWEAVNECWMAVSKALKNRVNERDLPDVLRLIRQQNALVRGAVHGSMLRKDSYDFVRLGTFLERADNTARILDVKYHVLLPSTVRIGSSYDNVQWENVLRSVSGYSSYRHVYGNTISAARIAQFIILDGRMPRSLAFCYGQITDNLGYLESEYGLRLACHDLAKEISDELKNNTIDEVMERGLHEFIQRFILRTGDLAQQIQRDYRFYE